MAFVVVEEWVGKIHDVFMAVDVRHGNSASRRKKRKAEMSKVLTEDNGENEDQTTRLYISNTSLQTSHLSPMDLSGPLSVQKTLHPGSSL